MGHRHGQAEWLAGVLANMVVEVLAGLEHHLLVEVQLVGARTQGPACKTEDMLWYQLGRTSGSSQFTAQP